MKKFSVLFILLLTFLIGVNNVNAASASIKVEASSKTVVVGNTTKVTVNVSSSDLGAWEYCISYDSSVLKLTNSTADAFSCVKTGYVKDKNQKSSTETFTFKALKSGNTKVTVKSYAVYAYSDEKSMSTSASSVSIKTMTQAELEATYSTNANLKSITVGDYSLNPKFDKNTLSYEVEVNNDVTSVNLSATKDDSTAEVSGTGTKELTEGDNKFEIIVTAQKGNTKVYVVNVHRKELDPISVNINGEEFFIIRKSDALPQYPTFTLTTTQYKEDEIPALHSEITGYTIVGLKDNDSKIGMYIYENEEFRRYEEVKSNSLTIFPQELPNNEDFEDYERVEIDFNGMKVFGYALSKNSNVAIIYGQNIETGDVLYYSYDKKNNTVQEYSDEITEYFKEKIKIYKYIILGFTGVTILLLFIIIFRKKTKVIKYNDSSKHTLEEETRSIEKEIEKEIQELEEKNKNKKNKNDNQNQENIQDDLIKEIPEVEEIPKVKEIEEEQSNEIRVSKNDKTVELKGFDEYSEKNKDMNLVDKNIKLSKRELKKQAKKQRKEEKARLKEF